NFISCYTEVTKNTLLDLIELYFETSYFTFNGKVYKQLDGSPMGNPASPTLAAIVVNYVITHVVNELEFPIPYLKLFVDDTNLAVPDDKIEYTLDKFNNFNDKIQFTLEKEQNNCIPFLDVIVN